MPVNESPNEAAMIFPLTYDYEIDGIVGNVTIADFAAFAKLSSGRYCIVPSISQQREEGSDVIACKVVDFSIIPITRVMPKTV